MSDILGPSSPLLAPRPLWWCPYHVTRHGLSTDCSFHAEILTDGESADSRLHRRLVIADAKTVASVPREDVLAIFAVIGQPDFTHARDLAREYRVPVLAYFDSHDPFPLDQCASLGLQPGWDWISPMLYCEPTESLSAFTLRAHDRVWHACTSGYSVVLTVQMYDRNGQERDMEKFNALQPLWMTLASVNPRVIGIAPFAVRRAGGVITYPWLRAWYDAYASVCAAPARPSRSTPSRSASPSSSSSLSESMSESESASTSPSPSVAWEPPVDITPHRSPWYRRLRRWVCRYLPWC